MTSIITIIIETILKCEEKELGESMILQIVLFSKETQIPGPSYYNITIVVNVP